VVLNASLHAEGSDRNVGIGPSHSNDNVGRLICGGRRIRSSGVTKGAGVTQRSASSPRILEAGLDQTPRVVLVEIAAGDAFESA